MTAGIRVALLMEEPRLDLSWVCHEVQCDRGGRGRSSPSAMAASVGQVKRGPDGNGAIGRFSLMICWVSVDGGHENLPVGGHRNAPLVATGSPHGWPRFLPTVLS
jgi:hypothetical protein